jgi:tetratricopeptide (TPR) repeat protein
MKRLGSKTACWLGMVAAISVGMTLFPADVKAQLNIINRNNREVRDEGDRLLDLGKYQLDRGRPKQAIASWQQAISLYRIVNDQTAISRTLTMIGDTYQKIGSRIDAEDTFLIRLAYANTLNDPDGKIIALNSLTALALIKDAPATALPINRDALSLSRKYDHLFATGTALYHRGLISARYGDHFNAIKSYYESLPYRVSIRDVTGQAYSLLESGDSYMATDNFKAAITNYGWALTIARQHKDLKLMAIATDRLIAPYLEIPNFYRIEDLLQNRTGIAVALDDLPSAILAQRQLGDLYVTFGNIPKARLAYQESIDYAVKLRDDSAIRESFYRLSALEKNK